MLLLTESLNSLVLVLIVVVFVDIFPVLVGSLLLLDILVLFCFHVLPVLFLFDSFLFDSFLFDSFLFHPVVVHLLVGVLPILILELVEGLLGLLGILILILRLLNIDLVVLVLVLPCCSQIDEMHHHPVIHSFFGFFLLPQFVVVHFCHFYLILVQPHPIKQVAVLRVQPHIMQNLHHRV